MNHDQPELKTRHRSYRRDVPFTDANDHNPMVLDECPRCSGGGKMDVKTVTEGRTQWSLMKCIICSGTGTTGERVPYFSNDAELIEVAVGKDGWVTCPVCRWRFCPNDRSVWSGLRHVRCGQRIKLISERNEVHEALAESIGQAKAGEVHDARDAVNKLISEVKSQ